MMLLQEREWQRRFSSFWNCWGLFSEWMFEVVLSLDVKEDAWCLMGIVDNERLHCFIYLFLYFFLRLSTTFW